ncbi:MAG: NADH-quinone oxidoreductase subunit M, partial [Pseudomonadota bacterium]
MLSSILISLCVLPLIGALSIFVLPKVATRRIALGVSLVCAGLSLPLYFAFDGTQSQVFQGTVSLPWISSLGIRFALGIDGLSFPLVLLTQLMLPIAVLASWSEERSRKAFMACFLVLSSFMTGTFLATD